MNGPDPALFMNNLFRVGNRSGMLFNHGMPSKWGRFAEVGLFPSLEAAGACMPSPEVWPQECEPWGTQLDEPDERHNAGYIPGA